MTMSERSEPRVIGLVGGLGPGATVHYYQALIRAHLERSLQPRLFLAHADVTKVFAFVEGGDTPGLARYLAGVVDCLARAGAEVAAVSAVMPHIAAPALSEHAVLPIVDMVDVVSRALTARGIRRAALFGTRAVVQSRFFGRLGGVDIVDLRPDEIDRIHQAYVSVVQAGRGTSETREELVRIGLDLMARERLDAVVLAGTELALVFDERTQPGFPIVDCARLHIDAITEAACAGVVVPPQ